MDKRDKYTLCVFVCVCVVCVCVCMYVLLSHKKEWNLAIYNNTDGHRGYYAKWNKSDTERQIPYDLTFEPKKQKWTNITKQKQTYRYREKTGDCQGEWGGGMSTTGEGA